MHLRRLVARGFRNLADLDFEAPSRGMVLLGATAQGKTNLLEAVYYPVLFRSFRGAADQQVVRLTDVVGTWLAVAFLPSDVGLASGPAAERRQYLNRVLSLSDRHYLLALTRYRAALAQRNSALRQDRVRVAQALERRDRPEADRDRDASSEPGHRAGATAGRRLRRAG